MKKLFVGFTLIEAVIAVGILAVLSTIAFPLFTDMMRESRRFDATSSLMTIEQLQENFRTNSTTYGSLANVWTGTQTPEGYYTLSITSPSSIGYTATATANGDQANDDEDGTSCNPLQVQVVGLQVLRTPEECW